MSKYKLIFCVIFFQSFDVEERRCHVKAAHRPAEAETRFYPNFKRVWRTGCWRAGIQRGSLKRCVSEGDRWSMPDSGLWIYPDLWWEESKAERASLQCGALKGEKSPDEGRVPAQWCCCLNWLPFILAHCSVLPACCLQREVSLAWHWTPFHPPWTQSCRSDCLIGVCLRFFQQKAICFTSL